jgi:hypothetical protein
MPQGASRSVSMVSIVSRDLPGWCGRVRLSPPRSTDAADGADAGKAPSDRDCPDDFNAYGVKFGCLAYEAAIGPRADTAVSWQDDQLEDCGWEVVRIQPCNWRPSP